MHRLRLSFLGAALILELAGLAVPALAQIEYEYDALGRLISVKHPDGKQTIYTYDAAGNRSAKTIHATVQNQAPSGVDDAYSMDEATTGEWDPRGNDTDPDSNPLTIVSVTQGQHGAAQITQSGTHVSYTPVLGFIGEDGFTYTVDDGLGVYDTAYVTVTVNNVPPTAVADATSVDENGSVTFDPRLNDSDPSGQPVTVTAVTAPANGTAQIVNNGTQIKYTPNANYFGPDSFNYTITGYHNDTDTAQVSVTVNSTNQPPVAVNDAIQIGACEASHTFDPKPNDSDPDGDNFTITAKTDGSKGTVTILTATDTLRYDVNAGASGADSFTYTISDPESASDSATVDVTIDAPPPSNVNPFAAPDNAGSIPALGSVIIDPRENDTDANCDPLTITFVTPETGNVTATIINNGTAVRLTSTQTGFPSFGSVTYTISDGNGGTASSTISYTAPGNGGGGI